MVAVWWQHSWQMVNPATLYDCSGLLLLAVTGLLLAVLMRWFRASARPAHTSPAHTSTPAAKVVCKHSSVASRAAVQEMSMQLACGCDVWGCQHQPVGVAGARHGLSDATQLLTSQAPDCNAGPAAPGSLSCCNSTSTSGSTASICTKPYLAADGQVLTRRRPQQCNSSRQHPVLHAHVRSTACLAASPSKASKASSPARLSHVKVITSFDSDASTPDSSPCSSRPTHFATLRVETSQLHDQDHTIDTATSSTSSIPPAAILSPVGGLVVVAARRLGVASVQEHPQDVQEGDDSSSSDQHELGNRCSPLVRAGAAGVQGAVSMQHTPARLGVAPVSAAPASRQTQAAEGGEAWATVTVAQCGFGKLSSAQAGQRLFGRMQSAHQLPAQCSSSTSQAAIGSAPDSAGGLLQVSVNGAGSNTEQQGRPAAQQQQQRKSIRVSFAPLPPSKNAWLQQLRQMPPEGKARFLRRLQLVKRRVWCMWRQRSRQQQQPQGLDRHGLKRDWQQAAAELQSDEAEEEEDEAGGCSPCKRAVGQGGALLRCRVHVGGQLSQPMLLG